MTKNNILIFVFWGLLFGGMLAIDSGDGILATIKIISGFIVILFFPGYFLISNIFNQKNGLDIIEKGALSFVFSIVNVLYYYRKSLSTYFH